MNGRGKTVLSIVLVVCRTDLGSSRISVSWQSKQVDIIKSVYGGFQCLGISKVQSLVLWGRISSYITLLRSNIPFERLRVVEISGIVISLIQ